ncbi:DUF7117 family protein [Natronomonas sp. EA1]|uniref:DUF7117 family protein n=1 Tax=Natronomonas sp. EA1 TaxID=3421655 RepID=UPI003EBB694C
MKVRGERECQECETRWSYYETGSVECPACGSLRSVGVDEERKLHTASAVTLDLSAVRNATDEEPLRRVAERAVEEVRPFVRGSGFIEAGTLLPLSETYLAASELRAVADEVRRRSRLTDDEEYYFLSLLRGTDQEERPPTEEVPDSLADARGLAYANAVKAYRSDLREYLDEHPDPLVDPVLETLGEHVKRIRALDGAVPVEDAERLVRAARALGEYLIDGDEMLLTEAQEYLSRLE